VIDELHPSVGSHPLMMEGFVMCSLKKSINNIFLLTIKLGFFGTITITTMLFVAIEVRSDATLKDTLNVVVYSFHCA
jgi:hypothetical protein